jgi:hypothetical protein
MFRRVRVWLWDRIVLASPTCTLWGVHPHIDALVFRPYPNLRIGWTDWHMANIRHMQKRGLK